MKIERIETAHFRLPLDAVGDAGHGLLDSEELITLRLYADGLEATAIATPSVAAVARCRR